MIATTDGRSIEIGTEIPAQVRFTTNRQLVQYAGAANDYSGIHYDRDYAEERGFSNVIVHGLLKAAILSDLACHWGGRGSWLIDYSARYGGVDLVGAPITCRGRVVDIDTENRRVNLELWTENVDGVRTTTATGLLQLANEETR